MIVYKCDECQREINDKTFRYVAGKLIHSIPITGNKIIINLDTSGHKCLNCIHDAIGKELE